MSNPYNHILTHFRSWTNYTGCLDLEDVSFHYTINQVQIRRYMYRSF